MFSQSANLSTFVPFLARIYKRSLVQRRMSFKARSPPDFASSYPRFAVLFIDSFMSDEHWVKARESHGAKRDGGLGMETKDEEHSGGSVLQLRKKRKEFTYVAASIFSARPGFKLHSHSSIDPASIDPGFNRSSLHRRRPGFKLHSRSSIDPASIDPGFNRSSLHRRRPGFKLHSRSSIDRSRFFALDRLIALFPDMDKQLLERTLNECGDDIETAIKSLTELHLVSVEQAVGNQLEYQIHPNDVANGEAVVVESSPPVDGADWVDIFVREMVSASNIDDARTRASRALELLEKSICASISHSEQIQIRFMLFYFDLCAWISHRSDFTVISNSLSIF
ncbi:hypothetical protein LXL04_001606 [Taraxacum kok-saghyz]